MEQKFTLDEAFDILYSNFLEEQISEDIKSLVQETEEDQTNLSEALEILHEVTPGDNGTGSGSGNGSGNGTGSGSGNGSGNGTGSGSGNSGTNRNQEETERINKWDAAITKTLDIYDKMNQRAIANAGAFQAKRGDPRSIIDASYNAEPGVEIVTSVKDMKFPQNIIFFLKQLVVWIKNNILNFIDKFSNIVRNMLGLKISDKPAFSKDQLKLNLQKAKKVETAALVNTADAYDKNTTINDILNGKQGVFDKNVKPARMLQLNDIDGISLLDHYDLSLTEDFDGDKIKYKVISIDTSRDLLALKESLQHFFDLFDNAYGSNNEKLFSIDDLQIMLTVLNETMKSMLTPSAISGITSGSDIYFKSSVDSSKLKDNLLRTRINTDNLKMAYTTTNKQINAISQIIMSKNMMGISQMGAQFAMLSSATYEIMIDLIDIIDERLKEAEKMEKNLQKMKKAYEKLTSELEVKRNKLVSVTGLTMTTVIQKQIDELYNSSLYMTQTVQLRLNTLALYISELNDTRAILKNLNAVNVVNKQKTSKFKALFSRK